MGECALSFIGKALLDVVGPGAMPVNNRPCLHAGWERGTLLQQERGHAGSHAKRTPRGRLRACRAQEAPGRSGFFKRGAAILTPRPAVAG